jgi:hypothetical protein
MKRILITAALLVTATPAFACTIGCDNPQNRVRALEERLETLEAERRAHMQPDFSYTPPASEQRRGVAPGTMKRLLKLVPRMNETTLMFVCTKVFPEADGLDVMTSQQFLLACLERQDQLAGRAQ